MAGRRLGQCAASDGPCRLGWSRGAEGLQDVRGRAALSAEAAASRNAQSGRGDEYSGIPSTDADTSAVDAPQLASVIVASAARLPKVQYPGIWEYVIHPCMQSTKPSSP